MSIYSIVVTVIVVGIVAMIAIDLVVKLSRQSNDESENDSTFDLLHPRDDDDDD